MPALIAFLIKLPRIATVALVIARVMSKYNKVVTTFGGARGVAKIGGEARIAIKEIEQLKRAIQINRKELELVPTILKQLDDRLGDLVRIYFGK